MYRVLRLTGRTPSLSIWISWTKKDMRHSEWPVATPVSHSPGELVQARHARSWPYQAKMDTSDSVELAGPVNSRYTISRIRGYLRSGWAPVNHQLKFWSTLCEAQELSTIVQRQRLSQSTRSLWINTVIFDRSWRVCRRPNIADNTTE